MNKIFVSVFAMFLSCILIPDIAKAKTAKDASPFTFEIESEGENTCRITGIRIKKDTGISVLKIPGNINGKTVVSIGKGKGVTSYSSSYYWNTFLMYNGDSEEKWFWASEIKPYKQREAQERRAEKIKKIILPDSIREIRDTAFAGLKGLKSIKLSKNLTTIGKCAFGDTSIRGMRLPSKVTAVGKQMFLDSPIKEINIPAKLKEGVPELARTTASWKRFTVSKKNPYYKVKSGLLFSKDGKILYAMVKPKKNVRIPDNVKRMDAFAFYKRSPQSVYIGAGVREMGGCSLSTKTRCKVVLSPQNRYLARSGMCIYRKKKRELLVGIPKGRVFRISRKVKKLVTNVSLVGIGKKYKVRKVYIPKSVETIEYGWGLGGFVHKNCRYYTERDYWTFQP